MVYSELVKKAIRIMYEAHLKDVDKGGYPYVFHPYSVACELEGEDSVCTALLHDVIEDHGDLYTFEFLESQGFSKRTIEALKLLTHDKDMPYMDYIERIKTNEIARRVKIEDLKQNLNPARLGGNKPKKYELYLKALSTLE